MTNSIRTRMRSTSAAVSASPFCTLVSISATDCSGQPGIAPHLLLSSAAMGLAAYDVIFRTGSRKGQIAVIIAAAGFLVVFSKRTSLLRLQRSTFQRLGVTACLSCTLSVGLYKAFASSRHTERLEAVVGFIQGKRLHEVSVVSRHRLYTRAIEMWSRRASSWQWCSSVFHERAGFESIRIATSPRFSVTMGSWGLRRSTASMEASSSEMASRQKASHCCCQGCLGYHVHGCHICV